MEKEDTQRRGFLKSLGLGSLVLASGALLIQGCQTDNDKEVSPPEDLMQEHGLLNRLLLIYDTCRVNIINKNSYPPHSLFSAVTIIKTFVEDYHEKQEENYLFPRFIKAHQLTDLVQVLLQQHRAGRLITAQILQLSNQSSLSEIENQRLLQLITAFTTMYRPHEAREDTILFPAFRKIVSKHEYDSLGEEFEKNEQKQFGKDGFETTVDKVANIEKDLGIYDLNQFTPNTF